MSGPGDLLSLYNDMVLPYCLMVRGNFQGDVNGTRGTALLRLQKRFAGLIAGNRGRYHADPLFAKCCIIKVGDHCRQQVRVIASIPSESRIKRREKGIAVRLFGVQILSRLL